jgi:hypothetical protein
MIIFATGTRDKSAHVEQVPGDGYVATVCAWGAALATASFPCSLAGAIEWCLEMTGDD